MPRDHRAILVNDPRVTVDSIDATLTTATQASPYPGTPEPGRATKMTLRAGGVMATGDEVGITCTRGGAPGTDRRAGAFTYERDGVTYGWDPPSVVTETGWINFVTSGAGTSSAAEDYQPTLVTLPDGRVLCATYATVGAGNDPRCKIRRYDPNTHAWTLLATLEDTAITATLYPALVAIGSKVYLYHLYPLSIGGSDYLQVAVWVSEDDGATWTVSTRGALSEDLDDNTAGSGAYQLAAAASNGAVLLAVLNDDGGDKIRTAGSSDGVRFVVSTEPVSPSDSQQVQVVPKLGGGWFLYWTAQSTSSIYIHVIGSQYQVVLDDQTYVGPLNLIDQTFLLHSFCAWVGEDGAYYVNQLGLVTTAPKHVVFRSEDGFTYERMDVGAASGSASSAWYAPGSDPYTGDPTYLQGMACTETRGMSITVGLPTDHDLDLSGSVAVWYAGGHTSRPLPAAEGRTGDTSQLGWSYTYFGTGDPDLTSVWDLDGVGTPGAAVVESDGYEITCTTAQRMFYEPTVTTGIPDREVIAVIDCASCTGDTSADRTVVVLAQGDGVNQTTLFIRLSATEINVRDPLGGSIASLSFDLSAPFSIMAALYDGRWAVWIRAIDRADQRPWTLVTSGSGLTPSGSAVTHFVGWGIMAAGSVTDTMTARRVAWTLQQAGTLTELGIEASEVHPRPFSVFAPALPGGLRLSAISGPAAPGDTWTIATAHRYGFEAFSDPSPAVTWRSTADNVALEIVWDLAGFADDAALLTSSLAVAVLGSNLRSYNLIARTNAGVDTTLANGIAQPVTGAFVSFSWQRHGTAIQANPALTVTYSRWLQENELAGCRFVDVTTGDGFMIVGNSSGTFGGGVGTHKRARILLDPDDAPEGLGLVGTGYIHRTDSVLYRHNAALSEYRWLKLSIPAQSTREGYYEIGNVLLGPMHVLGRAPAWEQGRGRVANVDLTTRRDGTRAALSRGRQRRHREVSWSTGIDETSLYGLTPTLTATSGAALIVAAEAETARLLEGLYDLVDGPRTPLVYLPRVDLDTESATLEDPRDLFYSRLVGDFSTELIQGEEGRSEVVRVNTHRFEEEL